MHIRMGARLHERAITVRSLYVGTFRSETIRHRIYGHLAKIVLVLPSKTIFVGCFCKQCLLPSLFSQNKMHEYFAQNGYKNVNHSKYT